MTALAWVLCTIANPLLDLGDATGNGGTERGDDAEIRADAVAGERSLSADVDGTALPQRLHEKSRRVDGPAAQEGGNADADPWLGAVRPNLFAPRKPWGAFALGGLVGFGAGYYYAGDPTLGTTFTCIDAVVIGSFVVSTVALNQLVVEHDFRSGKSLARDERNFGKMEARWYAASVVLALSAAGSRVFQAVGGLRTARATNKALSSFAFVPLGAGGAFELSW
ncbi:MAG: hypothetical protein A2289_19210 [Deltaproteobacteria bacterium RIFOXYA12_FULL_58_15]|nr:MAG: hypothetical protein A2289_19210 [Deltaproteobacteria bacterium RIFOXYA12_FULL_58_15]OGR11367.1 MAG: hypothetical protein A2341_12895 [Deltaproteobacteria bacterium RIFOXYB12_FULL_58_9]